MKYIYLIIVSLLFINCSKSPSEHYRKIVYAEIPKAVFQRVDLTTGSANLDTIETKWDENRLTIRLINDFNKDEKMMLVWITAFDYKNEETQKYTFNYDLLGDTIRGWGVDTSYYAAIGEIKKYTINGSNFEIIKRPSGSSKGINPSGYDYISKKYGWLISQRENENLILIDYEKRRLKKFEQLLIDTLLKDKAFFTLTK